jgi:hypothetical protein
MLICQKVGNTWKWGMGIARSRFPGLRLRKSGNGKQAKGSRPLGFFLLTGGIQRGYKKIWAMIGLFWFFENIGGTGSPFPFFWGARNKRGFQKISGFSWRVQRRK